jgi:hypothetical protein
MTKKKDRLEARREKLYTVSPTEHNVARENYNRYISYRDRGHKHYMGVAKQCDDFFCGNQWDPTDRADVEDEGRPALTLNIVMPTISAIHSESIRRRVDVRFKPVRAQGEDTSLVLTKLFKLEYGRNRYNWVESSVVLDGLVQSRGYFDCRMDFDSNINGELAITSLDPTEVIPDPDAKDYDPKTWKDVIVTRWLSMEDIEGTYGEKKARQLEYLVSSGSHYMMDSLDFEDPVKNTFGGENNNSDFTREVFDMDRKTIRAARIIERQHRKLRRMSYYIDTNTGDTKPVPEGWPRKKAEAFAMQYGLEILDRIQQRIRWTVTCDHIVLHDDWSPYDHFTVVPYFPVFRRGRPLGYVEHLISPQEQLNKTESQQLHIVNSTANSGWLVEENSLSNMEADELENKGSKTGLVIEYRRGTTVPQKIQANQIPTGLDRLSSRSVQYMQMISGVNGAVMGTDNSAVSGVTLEKRAGGAERLMDVPLDTLELTRHILAEVALGMIQKFYTDERIYYMTDDEDPASQPEEVVINQQQRGTIVNDITVGKYNVVIATAPSRETVDDMAFAELLNLRKIGVMVPDDEIVMVSSHPRRRQLAKRIRMDLGIDQTPEQQEAAAIQNQIAMMEAEKQLQLLDAQIAEKMANAQLTMAKAGLAEQQPDMELQKLISDREMRQREIELRERLAQVSKDAKDKALETSSATKLSISMLQSADKKRADEMKARQMAAKERTKETSK